MSEGGVWSGGGAFGFPQFEVPAGDQERSRRQIRIERYLPQIRRNTVPDLSKQECKELLSDIKEEGNVLFKEQSFYKAAEHYTAALFLGRMLETNFHLDVDKRLMSSLFTNRAACCNKIDMHSQAVEDCDFALNMDPNNIKGYFRKAQALMSLARYSDALSATQAGRKEAISQQKVPDARKFEELLGEIQCQVPSMATTTTSINNNPTKTSNNRSNNTTTATTTTKVNGETSRKATAAATVSVSGLGSSDVATKKINGADVSWLEGTSAKNELTKAKSNKQQNQKGKGGKAGSSSQKKSDASTNYSGLYSSLVTEEDDSEEDTDEDNVELQQQDESNEEYEEEESEGEETGLTWAEQCQEEPQRQQQQRQQQQQQQQQHIPKSIPQKAAPKRDDYGLDDFGPTPQNSRSVHSSSPATSTSSASYKSRASSSASNTQQAAQTKQYNVQDKKQQAIQGTPSKTDFAALTPPTPPCHPFDSLYDFCLVCDQCYCYTGYGPDAFLVNPKLSHKCQRWTLLVREKGKFEMAWKKVRPRPEGNFMGKYRLCTQFCNNESCRIGEPYCSFAHNDEELYFWNLDRASSFNVQEFIEEQRQNIFKGVMRKDWGSGSVDPGLLVTPPPQPPQHLHQPPPQQQARPVKTPLLPTPSYPNQPPSSMQQQQQQPPPPHSSSASNVVSGPKLLFPLHESHRYRLTCSKCLYEDPQFLGVFHISDAEHKCAQDALAVQMFSSKTWVKIRQRKNHRAFPGKYALCRNYMADPPIHCVVDEALCSFAHSYEEQKLWGLEKEELFNIQEFILQNHSKDTEFGISEVIERHGGFFCFLCHDCFFGNPAKVVLQCPDDKHLCNAKLHAWEDHKQLMHIKINGPTMTVEPIGKRPFVHLEKSAYYNLCRDQRYCVRRRTAYCPFAHSLVERDVWFAERDTNIARDEIVKQSRQIEEQRQRQPQQAQQPVQKQQPAGKQAAAAPQPPAEPEPLKCPFRVIEVCAQCRKNGIKGMKDPKRNDRCNGKNMGHIWSINKAYLMVLQAGAKELRPLPLKLPKYANFIICQHVREKGKCTYTGKCQFAHSDEERQLWTWMFTNKVMELDKVVEICEIQRQAQIKKPITRGQSVVETAPAPPPPRIQQQMPFELALNSYYCHYCSVQCNSSKQWDEHCAGDKHMLNVNSDREHQWNYRQPPWGVTSGKYALCPRHQNGNQCQYSSIPEQYNLCQFAHSQLELDEWIERWEWRQMKREIARKEKVFSYMDALLDDYENTEAPLNVICDDLSGVNIECDKVLTLFHTNKNTQLVWTFSIEGERPLVKVALLYNKDRLHFSLAGPQVAKDSQIAPGTMFAQPSLYGGSNSYRVEVCFNGGLFGSFLQWLILDFGGHPVVARKLNVELGTPFVQEKVKKLRETLTFDRWTGENRVIVKFYDTSISTISNKLDERLLKQYRAPSSADQVITQESVGVDMNRHNYVHKMHNLLRLEEMTRMKIIANYNLEAEVELMSQVQEADDSRGMIFARPGELFARVPLGEQLSEDTNAGKLILTSVQSVLIAPQNSEDNKVYEAIIVSRENFDYEGRGRDYIYLCLSPRCVIDLELETGKQIAIEIQFVMNRLHFCQMHYAIDQLKDTDIVFPDCSKMAPAWHERHTLQLRSSVLNEDQMKVVRHIVADRSGYSPPLIVYGPFGTGKTETLAQASMVLLREKPGARILICTHSNSAADLYITKHFDAFVKKNNGAVDILRVYFQERRINTVNSIVRKFCLLSSDGGSFEAPRREHILQKQLVLTTLSTALCLSELRLDGFFTHIFIDEGGQALETEAIMPLCLAGPTTCVVMAGDYMQMGPKVYSKEGRSQKLDRSLLQRLYKHYELYQQHVSPHSPLNLLLTANYRSKMEILRFLSAIFYDGPDNLKACSEQPDVEGHIPLTFYTAQGREIQEEHSTSWYNMAEVEEIVLCVEQLFGNWPEEWGERKAEYIGVITPYIDQVQRIRNALRQRGKGLGSVVVERVMNVQGKEFRAVFISTVRTRHMVENPRHSVFSSDSSECDGDTADFGFLSDQKLLNTAMTRAQSLVAVVGDPVALCAIGDCVVMWRAYLKHCSKMRSIHPNTITLESVKKMVNAIAVGPKGPNLAMLNQLADEGGLPQQLVPAPALSTSAPQQMPAIQVVDTASQGGFVSKDALSTQLAAESVIRMLQAEVRSRQRQSETEVSMSRVDGQVIMQSGNEASVASSSGDDEMDDNEDNLTNKTTMDYKFSKQQLLDLAASEPHRFIICTIHKDDTGYLFARPVNRHSTVQRIYLGSWQRCGVAFVGDEALVEMLDEDAVQIDDDAFPVGIVVDVIKNSGSVSVMVCRPAKDNHSVMIPLNSKLSPVSLVTCKHHVDKVNRGNVCVYEVKKDVLRPHHYEPLESKEGKLFVVRYLKFDAKLCCSLGIVVGVLPPGKDFDSCLKIVDEDYGVTREHSKDTLDEIAKAFPLNYKFPSSAVDNRRLNYSTKKAFTINGEGEMAQNALSVELRRDGNYLVGVHVADVSYFVEKDSHTDLEARERSSSLNGRQLDMLPERLKDLCGFEPGENRLALSLFFTIDKNCSIREVRPLRTMIKCCENIPYAQVENVVAGVAVDDGLDQELSIALVLLFNIACNWRQARLGNAASATNTESLTPKAHLLVEEILVQANHNVAMFLISKDTGTLRNQTLPHGMELNKWQQANLEVPLCAPALMWSFLPQGEKCLCTDDCECLEESEATTAVQISTSTWTRLMQLSAAGDESKVQQLLLTPNLHPSVAVAYKQLKDLVPPEQYVCVTEDQQPELWYHCGLHLDEYTQFTSPATCYMDLVVHRILVSLIDKQGKVVYEQDELLQLCSQITGVHQHLSHHQRDLATAFTATQLRVQPAVHFPVIQAVSADNMQLLFLPSSHIPTMQVSLDSLCAESSENSNMHWKMSIYTNQPGLAASGACEIDAKSHQVALHPVEWIALLKAARTLKPLHLSKIIQHFDGQSLTLQQSKDMSQVEIPLTTQHSDEETTCDVSYEAEAENIVKVQVGARIDDGMMEPAVELFHLTPTVALCVSHVTDPVECFIANAAAASGAKTSYRDMESYRTSWAPIIQQQAVAAATNDHHLRFVHNVPMKLQRSGDDVTATIVLLLTVAVKLSYDMEGCLVCIRLEEDPGEEALVWTGHGTVTKATVVNLTSLQLDLTLQHENMSMTTNLQEKEDHVATVQFMPKQWGYRCMEKALNNMESISPLAKNLALGRTPQALDSSYMRHAKEVMQISLPSLPPGNQTQDMALERALTSPFTVIKGGPGTGKTLTLVKIAALMVQLNKRVSVGDKKKPQVLICSHSEECIDRIIGVLTLLKSSCPRLARIYGPGERPTTGDLASLAVFADHSRLLTVPSALQQAEIVLSMCHASALQPVRDNMRVTQVLLDNAQTVGEVASLVPLSAPELRHIVLVGDVQQGESSHRSLLERYYDQGITLNTQYRMQAALASFPSQQFYGLGLTCGRDEQSKASTLKLWPSGKDRPMVFVCVTGEEQMTGHRQIHNVEEANQAARLASHLVWRYHVRAGDIAVLSFYDAQTQLIANKMKEKKLADITAHTVENSRGCEWDYVVLSTVRSQPRAMVERDGSAQWRAQRLGLAGETGLINMALTRAKKGLIIMGCPHLLKVHPVWRKLLKHYTQHQKVVNAAEFTK